MAKLEYYINPLDTYKLDIMYKETVAEYRSNLANIEYLKSKGAITTDQATVAAKLLTDYFSTFKSKFDSYIPLNRSLIVPLPPLIDRTNRRGIIAFREWELSVSKESSKLKSLIIMGMHCEWKPTMYADKVPTPSNRNGLYARALLPSMSPNCNLKVFGFVELLGHIEEHTDGVYRAEKAEIISLYVTIGDGITNGITNCQMVFGGLKSLMEELYPVPVIPVTPATAQLVLSREILISYYQQFGGTP